MDNLSTLVSLPLVAALVGWGTNYLAVKMLFRPRRPVSVLGLTFHGLIPRRQQDLARSIGATVAESLISHHDLQNAITQGVPNDELRQIIDSEVERFIRERVQSHPLLGLLVRDSVAVELRRIVVQQVEAALPSIMARFAGTVTKSVDIRSIVERRVAEFDLPTLEGMIQRIAARELRAIEIWGGVLGFLVGLVQVAVMVVQGR